MIRNIVADRQITHLMHFTKIDNADSILSRGLIPRADLQQNNIPFQYNDVYRFDNCLNATCLSVSFPNYKMFYPFRCNNANQDWIVIRLRPDILWEKDCAFCNTNAACNTVTAIPIQQRKRVQAFENMFQNITNMPTRETTNIPKNYTTNPQAEVLVFDSIETDYIIDVNFRSQENINNFAVVNTLIGNFQRFKYWLNEPLYSYRCDYAHWKNR